MKKWYRNSHYTIHCTDSIEWLAKQRAKTFHAVVTDPPFGLSEYSAAELKKRRNGKGGIWRIPSRRDGANRQATPRFTVMDGHDRMGVLAFHLRLAPALFRVLVPGGHVIISSQCLVSHLVAHAFTMAGFEARGQLVRVVKTLRGGDRPKFGDKKYRDVSVIPRSCFEPWLLFRKPPEGLIIDNLERYGTGALRRPSENVPLQDVLEVGPARRLERTIADHPSLKPQALMRQLVRAALPLGRGVILDPFMGSGSTIAAAKSLKLKSVGVETDARYFKMAKLAIPKLANLRLQGSTPHEVVAESKRKGRKKKGMVPSPKRNAPSRTRR